MKFALRCLLLCGWIPLAIVSGRCLAADDLARGQQGAVVCVSRPASQAGLEVLQRGGSAVDAAVAMAIALSVTYPAAGNIGGGGYMLVVPGGAGTQGTVIDFREVAPAAATREMFVDPAARTPHRRVAVPGTVRGLAAAHQRFGRLAWSELVAHAVRLAREGFALDAAVAAELNEVLSKSDKQTFASLHQALGRADGKPWRQGDKLVQGELADVLAQIAERGPDAFYTGRVAELIAAEMRRGGGLVTETDLASYQPVVRDPLLGTYRDCELLAVPPSSSGGTTLIEALNILESFDLDGKGRFSAPTLHLMIESSRRAYRDRAAYLGDPAMTVIPGKLLDKAYARELAAGIDLEHATRSEELAGEIDLAPESPQTTHLSVVDRDRMAVSLTYTLEQSFGSRVVVTGGGFLLNDEMNDFNGLPGVTDRTGRIGTEPNGVAPGKRMLSSMCPLVVRRDGRTLLVTGSPGGRTIINTVLGIVVSVVDYRIDIRQAVDAPRLHQAWFPDQVRVEPELLARYPQAVEQLKAMGHAIADRSQRQGDAHSVYVDPRSGELVGAADQRISGWALAY